MNIKYCTLIPIIESLFMIIESRILFLLQLKNLICICTLTLVTENKPTTPNLISLLNVVTKEIKGMVN